MKSFVNVCNILRTWNVYENHIQKGIQLANLVVILGKLLAGYAIFLLKVEILITRNNKWLPK